MYSGEATTYFDTLKYMLQDISELVVPRENMEKDVQNILLGFKGLMTDRTVVNKTFFDKFSHWRETVLPFVVENYEALPEEEKKTISEMHHVFCGLHVLHNLGIYAEFAIKEWEDAIEEETNIHGGFKNSNHSCTHGMFTEVSKLLSRAHRDQWES